MNRLFIYIQNNKKLSFLVGFWLTGFCPGHLVEAIALVPINEGGRPGRPTQVVNSIIMSGIAPKQNAFKFKIAPYK
jgi:hypothetical protein